jgi:hypothetical protein
METQNSVQTYLTYKGEHKAINGKLQDVNYSAANAYVRSD